MTTVFPSRYRIENASAKHIPLLGAVERACARIFPPGRIPEEFLDHTVSLPMLEEAAGSGNLLVVLDGVAEQDSIAGQEGDGAPADGRFPLPPVGYALLRYIDGNALLAQIDVHPAHARQGLGAALVKKIAQKARMDGHDALFLTTFKTIAWNAPFYAKLGFAILREEDEPLFLSAILASERLAGLSDRVGMRLALHDAV